MQKCSDESLKPFCLSEEQKDFLFLVSACVFCHTQSAMCGCCRIKKAIILKAHKKKMSKQAHAIIKHIKNKTANTKQKISIYRYKSGIKIKASSRGKK
jgi:hypothetical protein